MPRSPFLDSLPDAARARLTELASIQTYQRDQAVIGHEEESSEVFFVFDGLARATIFSENGKIVAFRDIAEGEIFGELSAIDGAPRSASVIAVTDLRVGRLGQATFRQLVEEEPGFAWTVLQYLTGQVRSMTARITEFSTMLGSDRLLEELIRMAEATGAESGSVDVHPAPTHFDLAARISTHREAVSREMAKLGRNELIRKKPGGILAIDLDGLRTLRDNRAD